MVMRTEKYICDINGCGKEPEHKQHQIQVIFTTNQTDGTGANPYLSLEKIDICDACLNKITQGNCIFASGAQGYNQYYFKS